MDNETKEKAMCLVDSDCDTLKLQDTGVKYIQSIPEDYGIISKAIVGPGRIGKSSFLNWLVGKDVFKIGSTTKRVTKGIWIYIDVHHKSKLVDMYIDVEGFGDPSKANAPTTDKQLLIIVLQICDVIMYNIKGVYDTEFRDKIDFVCNLFNRYRKQNQVLSPPILLSVLRDFDLDLPESPDQEFRDLFKNNKVVFETFREIKAFPLVKPVDGKMPDLNKTPDAQLCPEFVVVRDSIKECLKTKAKPLLCTTSEKNITGKVLAENLRRTVKYVNDDDLKFVSKTYTDIFKEQNEEKMKSALEAYEKEMKGGWPKPPAEEILAQVHSDLKNAAVNELEKCFIVGDSVTVDRESFKNKIEAIFKRLSLSECNDRRKQVCVYVEKRVREESYHTIGGFDRYTEDFRVAEMEYMKTHNLGPEKETVWSEYEKKMKETKTLIEGNEKVKKDQKQLDDLQKEVNMEKQKLQYEQGRLDAKEKEILDAKEKGIKEKEQGASALTTVTEVTRVAVGIVQGVASTYSSFQKGKYYSSAMAGIKPSGIDESSSASSSEDTPL